MGYTRHDTGGVMVRLDGRVMNRAWMTLRNRVLYAREKLWLSSDLIEISTSVLYHRLGVLRWLSQRIDQEELRAQ